VKTGLLGDPPDYQGFTELLSGDHDPSSRDSTTLLDWTELETTGLLPSEKRARKLHSEKRARERERDTLPQHAL
jgi:hypothetical protein